MKIQAFTLLTVALIGAWSLTSALADHHKDGEKKKDTESAEKSDDTKDDAPAQRERGQRPDGQRGDRPGGDGQSGPQGGGGGFAALDTDGDGSVTNTEFLAVQITRANETFERLDADGDGTISESEAASAQRGGQQRGPGGGAPGSGGPRPGGGFGGGFANLDKNSDGVVTEEEFLAANADRQKELFAQIDTDNNGEVTEEDMQAFFQRMRERFRGGRGGQRPGGEGAPGGGNPRPPRPE